MTGENISQSNTYSHTTTLTEIDKALDKLVSILFVEGYVEKDKLQQVYFLLNQSVTTFLEEREREVERLKKDLETMHQIYKNQR